MEIIPGVHVLKNNFVNMVLISDAAGLTLIDAGIAKSGPKLVLQKIAALGLKPSVLKNILITHSDPDHVGGANELKRLTGAKIFASAHEGERMSLGKMGREPRGAIGFVANSIMGLIAPMPPQAADGVLKDGDVLPYLGGLHVLATPGHTPGHLAFFAPAQGVLFAGDSCNTMGKNSGSRIQFAGGPFTWDFAVGKKSLAVLASLSASTIVCGHGEPLQGQLVFPHW